MLGIFRVIVDGQERSHWSRRKPKLLLKLLALQSHHQLHREQAMEMLWPDSDPEAAVNNLHKAIHLARHDLEPELNSAADSHFIVTQGQQILLTAPGELWIDVEEFEQRAAEAVKGDAEGSCEKALAIYRGDLLTEDLYEDWTAMRREQLRSNHQELLMKLAGIYESCGQYQLSIGRLTELVAADPSNEEAHRDLMRLYAVTGHRQQALREYKECCESLRRELDAAPEEATRELYEQIVAGKLRPIAGTEEHEASREKIISSLAILPLINLSANAGVEYFSDGITESLINNLSQLTQLRVMAHSAVLRYKGKELDAQQVGRELKVSAVLTGRVLQVGDRLSIRTELVDTTDGARLWGKHYERNLADIFAVQEEIAREISENLRLKLTGEDKKRLTKRQTENTEAYYAYLKGRYYWNKRTIEWLKKGVEHFRQAIDLDPSYASAYAGLSDSYTLLVVREALPPDEGFAKAKAAAAMALKIDEQLSEAHASLGHAMLHNWEWEDAEKEFKRAIELNPGYPSTHHWYSEYLTAMGRCPESILELKLAAELDPLSLIINADLGRAFYYARQYDQVIKQEEKTLEMDPGFWLSHINLGRSYTQKGMHAAAIAELRKASELSVVNTESLSFLGFAYAAAGKIDEALKMLRALNKHAQISYVPPYHIAIVYAGLRDREQAFRWLEQSYERHAVDLFTLKVEPMFDSLRSDPRFADLLRRCGLD